MKATIKQKAIQFIASDSEGKKRTDVVYNVLRNNKSLKLGDYEQFLKDFNTKWRGYYSDAFQQWEREGLIKRSKGIYKATEIGKAYAHNPKIIGELLAMRRKEQERRMDILSDFWELRMKYERMIDAQESYKSLLNNLNKLIINA